MAQDDSEKIVQRLTNHLDISTHLRAVAKADPGTGKRRQHLRTWQAGRLARTHADLLASPRFGLAAAFFLTDVYGTKDVSSRDQEVIRAVPAMTKFLPVSALETVADVIELDALSEDLDAAMVVALGARVTTIDAATYGWAYRTVDRRTDRERQIYLVEHLGQSLDRLANRYFAGTALALMRKPAQIAGFGDLHEFLERGYTAVHAMGSIEEFLTLVVSRERLVLNAVFAGDDSLLSEGSASPADSQAQG
ncbi:MAG TPA: hypothetical protein VMG39_10855 [Pseudolabrys sp.]|nr:hypothetical protein [Pseudolabrys sp.]